MDKSQLVIAKVHVIEIAKSALELSYKPVILITWRNVILREIGYIRNANIEMSMK